MNWFTNGLFINFNFQMAKRVSEWEIVKEKNKKSTKNNKKGYYRAIKTHLNGIYLFIVSYSCCGPEDRCCFKFIYQINLMDKTRCFFHFFYFVWTQHSCITPCPKLSQWLNWKNCQIKWYIRIESLKTTIGF